MSAVALYCVVTDSPHILSCHSRSVLNGTEASDLRFIVTEQDAAVSRPLSVVPYLLSELTVTARGFLQQAKTSRDEFTCIH